MSWASRTTRFRNRTWPGRTLFRRWPVLATALSAFVLSCGGDDSAGPDAVPPAAIQDLSTRFVSHDSTGLTWTAPGDDGTAGRAAGYELRYDSRQLTEGSWETRGIVLAELEAKSAGATESLTVTGLPVGRSYLALRARDEVPNWSALSNSIHIDVPLGDTIPPADITSLGTIDFPDPTSLTLTWIAPGSDGESGQADHYEVKRNDEAFTEASWDSSGVLVGEPLAGIAGGLETLFVDGLTPETTYYFAIRTYDAAGNRSGLSNQPPLRTGSLDPIPPAAVTDLSARLDGLYDIVLTWTATADDGSTGSPALAYDLRQAHTAAELEDWESATQIPSPTPAAPGRVETLRIANLPARTNYAFALEVLDDSGNRSTRSNVAEIATSDSSCVVRADGTGDFATIGDALLGGGGCEIVLEGGVYSGEGNRTWPASDTHRIRSASGSSGDAVVDFGGFQATLPPALVLEGVTLRNASSLLLQAEDETGFVLEANRCAFDNVSLESEQPVERGPIGRFEECEFRRGTSSPLIDLGEIYATRCSFVQNQARIAIAYRSEWIDCDFEENDAGTNGALLRSFNDLQGTNRFLVQGCRFVGNATPILGPQNGLVEVEDCVFVRNSESCAVLNGTSSAVILSSTFARNTRFAGSIIRTDDRGAGITFERALIVGNGAGPLFDIGQNHTLTVSCTDVFGNDFGDWIGPLSGLDVVDGNLSVDPLFCDWGGEDYALRANSPCAEAAQPDCGRIGGLDVGCEAEPAKADRSW
ncbi:MAG: hypothetical protein H6682_23035 [Candidatus Eisenbacteria bacterium]|nr:hypothetical protein [Candidatus Eisenbacteria bacterium]